jgi:PAS domain S-box-containing protein
MFLSAIRWSNSLHRTVLLPLVLSGPYTMDQKKETTPEQRYRALVNSILDTAGDGILTFDAAGQIETVNPAALKVFGYTADAMIGQSLPQLLVAEEQKTYADFLVSSPKTGMEDLGGTQREVIGRRQDGTSFPLELSVSAVLVDERRLFTAIVRDLTVRKQAEEQLLVYQRELRSLAGRLILAEEGVRRQLSSELHDRVGQTLTLVKMKIDAQAEAEAPGGRLNEVRTLLRQMSEDIRTLVFELSPPVLYELGLEAAVHWLAGRLQSEHGLQVSVEADGQTRPLAEDVRALVFRSVHELLFNVVKHAQVQHARVTLAGVGDWLHLEVADDGAGFAPPEGLGAYTGGGFGLFSIRERMSYIGGQFDLETHPGHGTRCRLVVPLPVDQPTGGAV